jgi:hypothetical protein
MITRKQKGRIYQLRQWFKTRLIQNVPEEIAACEFECRRTDCLQGEWETCPNRLRGIRPDNDSAK